MTNGKQGSQKDSPSLKRVSDVIPEGNVTKPENDISSILDKDITITAMNVSRDALGGVKHVTMTFDYKGEVKTLNVTKSRVIAKLVTMEKHLPFIGKISKGDRYYDIT